MKTNTWEKTKPIIAYLSLLLNISLIGTWAFLSLTSKDFEEASAKHNDFWMVNSTILFLIAIVAGIFSIIYFARANGILPKIFMVMQVLIVLWFGWSLL
jgi:hypothetical protein